MAFSPPPAPEPLPALLKEHAAAIGEVKSALLDELPKEGSNTVAGAVVDDVWVLRFVLSNATGKRGTVEDAITAARETLKWRRENEAKLLRAREPGSRPDLPQEVNELLRRTMCTGYCGTTCHGEPLFVIRSAKSEVSTLMQGIADEQLVEHLMHAKEVAFMKVDAETRKRQTLVKLITVNDFADISIFDSSSRDKRFFKGLGETSRLAEVFYPQLQGPSAMMNIPRLFKVLFKVAAAFMPKRTLEKINICKGNTNKAGATSSKCPFASKRLDASALPDFLGGTGKCPAALMPPKDRSETESEGQKPTAQNAI